MLVGSITSDNLVQRKKAAGKLFPDIIPPSGEFMSLKNISERPLKSNSKNSTFKGLSFKGENKKQEDKMKPVLAMFGVLAGAGLALRFAPAYKKAGEYSIGKFTEFIKDKSGIELSVIENHVNHLNNSKLTKKLIQIDGDKIIFNKKTVSQHIWDGLMYPIKIMPADILNDVVKLIGKIKPFKAWSEKTLKHSFFVGIRQRSKIDAEVNSLRGLFEKFDKLKDKSDMEIASNMFRQSVKMFDPETGNYDTKHERSLNRIISGMPPALFLANDAYNLSRMMDDDDKAAKKEKSLRFKQETVRVGFNAYITLITLGALQRYINNSALGIFLMTGFTTLVTEAFSRFINGKHITRLTPEEARRENEANNAPEAQIKPELSFKSAEKPKEETHQKPLLSFDTLMKASALVIAGGFGVKGLRKINLVETKWKAFSGYFNKLYKKATEISDYQVSREHVNKIADVLEQNNFKDLAAKYRNIAKSAQDGETIHLGTKNRKIRPFVNFLIAPFKFAWNTVTLPYNLLTKVIKAFSNTPKKLGLEIKDKTALDIIVKNYASDKNIKDTKALEAFIKNVSDGKLLNDAQLTVEQNELLNRISDVSSFAKSIEKIGREALRKGFNEKQFKSYVSDNIMKGFNAETMSNISNSELSNLAKTAASIATIWFLMTDNYNMVMLKSNGNDVEGAKTKFTERFVQEGSRLFYQTLLIDLFNKTFKNQYNGSLFGMSWITLTNTTLGEWLTRKSVGVPIGVHTRDELIELENKQNNATGFERKYYDFMKRLTGKRSIKSYEVPAKNYPAQTINFTNNSILDSIIKQP